MLVSVDQRGRGYSLYRDADGRRTNPIRDRLLLALNQSSERPGARNHAWFSASLPPDHFETRKREFLGGPYSSLANPMGVSAARLTDTGAATEDFMGVFQYELELVPGGVWEGKFLGRCLPRRGLGSQLCRANERRRLRPRHRCRKTARFIF